MLLKNILLEASPPDDEIEAWIVANKPRFKKQYGKKWAAVLYATAWNMYKKKQDETK